MSGSDDESPQLSAATLAALQEFYTEREAYEAREAASMQSEQPVMPEEDWQLSQFWYDDNTAETLAKETLDIAGPNGSIACVSCPTLYHKIRELKSASNRAVILEFDSRFERFKDDFVLYDYKEPLRVPEHLHKAFDVVVADPPFLTEECLTKTAQTVRLLTKAKVIVCTGAVMEETCGQLLGTKICEFRPKHSNNLANEFRCFINYEASNFLN